MSAQGAQNTPRIGVSTGYSYVNGRGGLFRELGGPAKADSKGVTGSGWEGRHVSPKKSQEANMDHRDHSRHLSADFGCHFRAVDDRRRACCRPNSFLSSSEKWNNQDR